MNFWLDETNTFPDLSKISPLVASKVLSIVSLVFDSSLYFAPCTIWRLNNWTIKIIPIKYVNIVIILYLKLMLFLLIPFTILLLFFSSYIFKILYIQPFIKSKYIDYSSLKISCQNLISFIFIFYVISKFLYCWIHNYSYQNIINDFYYQNFYKA